MKKVVLPLVILALVAAGVAAGFRFWKKEDSSQYRFVEVTRGDVRSTVSSTGNLQATQTVQVGTQVSGQIAEILVDFNDRVRANQLVARIDPTLLQQAVRSAEADLARSRADLAQAEVTLRRAEALRAQEAATEEALDAARSARDMAKAAVTSAEVNVERARQNLTYTEIRSPIDGVVLDRTAEVGQTVAASLSAPQLFLIAGDLGKMEILAAVDESDIGRIDEGQTAEFTVQAYPDETFTGAVQQVRLQSTTLENVVNYTVVVSVANEDGRLLPGMTATVDFLVSAAEDVLKVPNAALRFRPTEEMAARLRAMREERQRAEGGGGASGDSARGADRGESAGAAGNGRRGGSADRAVLWHLDAQGRPEPLPVRTGLTDGQNTEVSGPGLEEGMQVIAGTTSGTASTAANPFQGGSSPPRFGPPGA